MMFDPDAPWEKIVRLVYMDEAGTGSIDVEPWLTVAAVFIDADKQLRDVQKALKQIIETRIPVKYRENFLRRENFYFHAGELFGGYGKIFNNRDEWPIEKRLEIADDITAIFENFRLPIIYAGIERKGFRPTIEDICPDSNRKSILRTEISVAFFRCTIEVEKWMRARVPDEKEACLLIADQNELTQNELIERVSLYLDESGYKFVSLDMRQYCPFQRIEGPPRFETNRPGSPLQLADFCAYVLKRWHMNDSKIMPYYERLTDYTPLGYEDA